MPVSLARIGFPLALMALAVLGCGGKSLKPGDDASSGATGSGGTGDGNLSGGTATAGHGTSGANSCDAFRNEAGPQLTVLLRNETKIPIYIGPQMPTCGLGGDVYRVADASGEELRPPELCALSCQDLFERSTPSCPPIACPVSAVITLQPGEAATQLWTAAELESVSLPGACRPADGTEQCDRVASVKPGNYIFTAQAGTSMDCSQFGGMCMLCVHDSLGGCTTYGAVITGPLISAKLAVKLDPGYGVGSGGGEMPLPIEVVFN